MFFKRGRFQSSSIARGTPVRARCRSVDQLRSESVSFHDMEADGVGECEVLVRKTAQDLSPTGLLVRTHQISREGCPSPRSWR